MTLSRLRAAFKDAKSSLAPLERIPTDLLGFDYITGGGLPVGRIIEIFGHESSGKTALALWFTNVLLKRKEAVAYIDAERTLSEDDLRRVNIDPTEERLLYWRPNSGEQALEMAIEAAHAGVKLVVIDSVPALTPSNVLKDKDIGDITVAAVARLLSSEMSRLTSTMDNFNCTLVFLNQLRSKIGSYGNPETTPGGYGLRFMCSLRLRTQRKDVINTEPTGIVSQIRLEKSKISKPRSHTEVFIADDYGIDPIRNCKDVAIQLELLVQRGSYFYWSDAFAATYQLEPKIGQGAKSVYDLLAERPEIYQFLYREISRL